MEHGDGFCECDQAEGVSVGIGEWGQWYVCEKCGLPIEETFEYFNHYDGKDHVIYT